MKLVCLDLAHQDSIDIETEPRFRERRTAVEDTGAIGGGERMELQTKTPESLSQSTSGTIPSPTRVQGPLDQLVLKHLPRVAAGNGTRWGGGVHGFSSRCPQPQIAKGAGLKRPRAIVEIRCTSGLQDSSQEPSLWAETSTSKVCRGSLSWEHTSLGPISRKLTQ